MAATIAFAIGRDSKDGKRVEKECTRLGAQQAEARAQTYKTFTTATVNADGSGEVKVERMIHGERKLLARLVFGAEDAQANEIVMASGGSDREVVEDAAYEQSMREFDRSTNGGAF